jgi:hypothetical protein
MGGFLMNQDDCTLAHTNWGSGNVVVAVDTTSLTTGSTGQAEAVCNFFGLTGIDHDGWGNWTATMTGLGVLTNCGAATDSKVAVWPGTTTCPAAGTALACNDDSCGLQSAVSWNITSGASYTFQIGTFPGAAGGPASWSVTQSGPPPCGQKDDGTTENALGLTAGGEMGWLTVWDSTCFPGSSINSVESAYGTLMFPGSVTNGANSKVVLYADSDTDNDPTTGTTVLSKTNTVVVNGDTDILNKIPVAPHTKVPGTLRTWVLVSADQVAGQFPGPMDQTPPTHSAGAWVVGSTLGPGTLNTTTLLSNDVAPLNMAAIGFPANWLSRIDNTGSTGPGTPVCFGSTNGDCPCLNGGGAGAGCANGTGAGGSMIATGTARNTGPGNTLEFSIAGVINNNGLLFSGVNTIGGGSGTPFGDGIRCCGGSVVRIEIFNPPGTTSPAAFDTDSTVTTITPQPAGTKRCYQYWYRDPATSPCGNQFNLTNAVTVTWTP